MEDKSAIRLYMLRVMVLAFFATLVLRLFYIQLIIGDDIRDQAQNTQYREIINPADRGLVLDQTGRVLIGNTSSLVISVSKMTLEEQEDDGEKVLRKLAVILDTSVSELKKKLSICGTEGAPPRPVCWNGSPYQPIPVAKNVATDLAVKILERSYELPGVTAEAQTERDISSPFNVNLAHILGYLGPVDDLELAARADIGQKLQRTDLIGRAGIEAYYDSYLRGQAGITTLAVDRSMRVTGEVDKTNPVTGDFIILNIDAALQKVVEEQLEAAVARSRESGYAADGAAAVVLDVTNGHVLAMASNPTYNLEIWRDGATEKEYRQISSKWSGSPMVSRAIQGIFAPASTFKMVTSLAAAKAGFPLGNSLYECPSSFKVGNRTMTNHESHAYGNITLRKAIEVSCNTVFYKIGYDMWLKDGGNTPKENPQDPIEKTSIALGLGTKTGIDLPSESSGRIAGRKFKLEQYAKFQDLWCYRAETGYPEVAKTDATRAAYLKEIAKENCIDGDVFRGGDAANMAIGQGDTAITPLQLAVAYAALANGGKVMQPQVAKAILSPTGKVIKKFKPVVNNRIKINKTDRSYIIGGLTDVIVNGTGRYVFSGWPQGEIPIAGKTGTGQASAGKDDTGWFASFAPANKPKYAVVFMVSQGGLGGNASAPGVRKIYEAIFGVRGGTVNPKWSVLKSGEPTKEFPTISKDGQITEVQGTHKVTSAMLARFMYGGS
jgi:penicillin-binding protein 2